MARIPPRSFNINTITSRHIGSLYEKIALNFLKKAGLHFIEANIRFSVGELDIIMRDQQTWIFVEVRYRKTFGFGGAAVSVTPIKCQRLLNAAALWLQQRDQSLETANCRFDIIAITGEKIEWLQNALHNDLNF